MMRVVCPGCSEERDLGTEVQVGDVVPCASCAGALFRLEQHDGDYILREAPQASCPQCQALLRLPDAVQPGENFCHCGRTFVVTHAYGAYALEPPDSS